MPAAPRSLCRPPRHAGLARFVECVFYSEGAPDHRLERILPNGKAQLLVNLAEDALRTVEGGPVQECGGAAVSGPYAESFVIETAMQQRVAGAAFRAGGAAPFLRMPVGEVRGRHVDCSDLWGGSARTIRERLCEAHYRSGGEGALDELEAVLLERASSFHVDSAVRHATCALETGTPVSVLREQLGLSPARFVKRFDKRVGLTPKRFARVRRSHRLLGALASAVPVSGAHLASVHGFSDQAHMIREFRRFATITPTSYRARAPGETSHLVIA